MKTLLKTTFVSLSTLPVLAFARYGIYDDDDCCDSGYYYSYTNPEAVSELLWGMFGISLVGLIILFLAYNKKNAETITTWIVGIFMFGGFSVPLISLFSFSDAPIASIANLILCFLWYGYYTELNNPSSSIHKSQSEQSSNNDTSEQPKIKFQTAPRTTPKPTPQPKTEPTPPPKYLLPFPLKAKPTLAVNPSLYGDFDEQALMIGIVKSGSAYLKLQIKSKTDFIFIDPRDIKSNIYAGSDGLSIDLSIAKGLGEVIHNCVWKLVLANTAIDSREYLPFGGNYIKYLAELLGDFGEIPVTTGIQIYLESLTDYYLSKLPKFD